MSDSYKINLQPERLAQALIKNNGDCPGGLQQYILTIDDISITVVPRKGKWDMRITAANQPPESFVTLLSTAFRESIQELNEVNIQCHTNHSSHDGEESPPLEEWISENWEDLKDSIQEKSPKARSYLEYARPVLDQNKLYIELAQSEWVSICRRNDLHRVICSWIKQHKGDCPEVDFREGNFDHALEEDAQRYEKQHQKEIEEKQRRQKIKAEKEKENLILGDRIKTDPVNIDDITDDQTNTRVTIEGKIFECEFIQTSDGKKNLVDGAITDQENSIAFKIFTDDSSSSVPSHEGEWVKLRGRVKIDTFSRNKDLVIFANDINKIPPKIREERAPETRVELHCHSNMSRMDAVADIEELVERAAFWDHDALAITDHGVAHSFPEAAHAAEEYGVKMIFGVEGYIVEDDRPMVLNRTDEFPDNPDRLLPDRCVLIDGETTGVSPINNDLFQVGVLALEDGEIVDEYSSLLPVEEIPREILERSPVEREDILSAPDPDQVKKDLQEFVGDRPVVMYEADFLRHFLREFGIEFSQPVIHLRRIVEAVWKPENPGLDTLVQTQLNSKVKHSYDAARDVRRVKDILEELHDHFQGNERSARCNRAYQVEIPDGLSIALIDDLDREPDPKAPHNHIILLARNDTGMKNLYELISKSHIENFYRQPRMKRSEIQDHREGLIVGSACEAGEIFQSVLRGESDEEIKERMKFYDLVEVQPVENNTFMLDKDGEFENITTREDIQQLTKKIHDLGREMEKLVVGTGDVHFLDPKHDIYRSVLQNAQDFSDADSQAPLYYRTTREMLGCFGYLGDDRAREVVVENPRRVAEMCEEIDPIPDGFHPPEIKGAEEQFTGTIHERARELYGESLPDVVEERLKKEEDSILENQFANLYVMAGKLVDKSLDDGYLVGSRGSVGSSFTAFLMGITEVNPLAAHYRCESCDWVQFPDDTDADVGVDLPSKECPECGELLDRDGYNIPFEVFCGFEGDKIPDIDLNFSGEYQQEVFEYVERLFGSENVFRAGTISTLATKMSWNFVQEYLEERNLHKRSAEQDRLTAGVEGVRKTTGQHPGGMIIVPEDKDITDFTPVNYPANDDEAPFKTTHFDYHAMEEQLVKLDILGHDDPTQLRHLQDLTGVDPVGIPLDDEQTMKLFSDVSVLGIDEEELGMKTGVLAVPEFGTTFVRDMVEQTRPSSFADLLRISGLSHGTDVWLGNAKTLIESNRASLESVISARDDIMNRLIEAGLPEKMAFQIMEDVRKGRGLNEDQIKSMRANDVPKWYIQSCQKIKYLFPKAHAAAYVIMAFRIAYFKVHHPTAFYASYFSLKANHMDARYVTSLDDVEQRLQFLQDIIQDRERDHTARDKSERTVMEVLREAYLRGISVRPPRPAESEPRRFTVEDENVLRAPYVTVESLGGTVADSIRQAYDQSPFSSIEDAENRTGINSSVMENARECGFFEDLPETENLDMFEPV